MQRDPDMVPSILGFARRSLDSRRLGGVVVLSVVAFSSLGCGHATRSKSPQAGTTVLTAATVTPRIERVLVSDGTTLSMAARRGCLAAVQTGNDRGGRDELRIRCPKPERMKAWFEGVDRLTANLAVEPVDDDDRERVINSADAQLVIANGAVVRLTNAADAGRLSSEVRALAAELAAAETPAPGPASPAGWQMVRVAGPAHVLFAGDPARGVLDAKMSTSGQYFCEFVTQTDDGPIRATKSGWIAQATAARAIDEVLVPFKALGGEERPRTMFVAATTAGAEKKADAASMPAVLERFEHVQHALGDACLPTLETGSAPAGRSPHESSPAGGTIGL